MKQFDKYKVVDDKFFEEWIFENGYRVVYWASSCAIDIFHPPGPVDKEVVKLVCHIEDLLSVLKVIKEAKKV